MSVVGIFALVLTGAGTLASILGIFFAIYAKQNGKVTREFLSNVVIEQNKVLAQIIREGFEKIGSNLGDMHQDVKKKT